MRGPPEEVVQPVSWPPLEEDEGGGGEDEGKMGFFSAYPPEKFKYPIGKRFSENLRTFL